ncbi:hypothetical protein PSN45_004795 [Yamadazyma tenuis]|nr:hypothetical protein PSN45_004795 [Yamadazyma tenuis]
MYIIPTEKNLFFQGFEANEYAGRQPILLRGCLFIRILKPAKIKSISLQFTGSLRTDWPEGIPPKKNVFSEENNVISHTWPFYSMSNPLNTLDGGADLYSELPKNIDRDVSHLSLNDSSIRPHSPSLSQLETTNPGLFKTGLMKKANTSPQLHPVDSFNDLSSVLTGENEVGKPGTFPPGDYIYNFEHPLRPSLPETTEVTFGDVSYELEATIIRAGAFKSNLIGKMPINLVRTPSEYNLEENEPIIISRDWEDQLRYDIVIGGKSIVLDSYLPLAFRFVPLWGKVALHRIRVYLSENLEYYCQNKKVHRMEPSKKYLLLEHKAKKGKSLLTKKENGEYGDETEELLPRELEFQLYVPQNLNGRVNHVLHPDTSFDEIQAHHWIKLCLRISKLDPEHPEKRKHYEISIDSPIHVLSPLAAHGNTLLPAYNEFLPEFLPEYTPASPPLSPEVIPVESTATIGKLFSALNPVSSNSSHKHETPSAVHSPTPEIFHHINSFDNNDDPIERDLDMHLEANLYKPDPNESRSQLNSPQAMPHIGSLSPVTSPMLRPIAPLVVPSKDPPPFEAASPPPDNEVPPPAYEKDSARNSMSPGVTRDSSTSSLLPRGRSKTNSSTNTNGSNGSYGASNEISIKDLLTNSLGGHRNSVASKKSQSSGESDKSKGNQSSSSSLVKSKGIVPDSDNTILSPKVEHENEHESEEDIVNLIGSPELIPEAVSPRRNLSPMGSPRTGVSPIASPRRGISPISTPLRSRSPERGGTSPTQSPERTFSSDALPPTIQFNGNEEHNGHKRESESPGYQSEIESSSSRRTSIASFSSNEMQMGQNIPLLSSSTQSLLLSNPANTRTASVGSILFDPGRRHSSNTRPSIVDFVDGGDLGGDFFRDSMRLTKLNNPRRHKETNISEEVIESDHLTKNEEMVHEEESLTGTSESDLTVNENQTLKTQSPARGPTKEIPGFKIGFSIE